MASRQTALLAGYRAAGWFCAACSTFAMVLAILCLRRMGVVGKVERGSGRGSDRRNGSPVATSGDSTRHLQASSSQTTPLHGVEGEESANGMPLGPMHHKTHRDEDAMQG